METTVVTEAGVSPPVERDEELIQQNQVLIALLKSWEDDDPEDQRETWAILQETLPRQRFNIPSHLSQE